MKRIVERKGFKVLVTVICILSVFAIMSVGNGYVYNFVTGYIITPIQYVATGTVSSAGDALTSKKSYAEIERENKRLEQENMRLNDLLIDYYDIKKEYDELSQFLDIKKDNKSFEVAVASVIGRDPNENFSGFTLNRGINDGISVNAPVLTEKGLVGWISEVGISSCKVTTILSPDTKISACDKASSDKGIVSGSAELYEKGCTSLKNIRKGFKIAKDDIVVTANSVLYPENIKIGKVKEISTDSYTGMPIAVIEPFEDIKHVSSVVIVKKFG